ncbi:MAG TPA: hypothetical protein VMV92_33980 [Streptosporangiaceae bacterium]|nr:hypothetical protein [Streptosporangiaceae bacterium]
MSTSNARPRRCWRGNREDTITGLLPSWRPGAARTAVLDFVRLVTEPGESFVPSPGRVAVRAFFATARDPVPGVPCTRLAYRLRGWTVVSMKVDFRVVF